MRIKAIYNPKLSKDQLAFVKRNKVLNPPYEPETFLVEFTKGEDIERFIFTEPSYAHAMKHAHFLNFEGYSIEIKRIMANTGFLMADLISARDKYWFDGRNYVESSEMYKKLAIKVNRIRHILRQRYDYPKMN